MTIDTKELRKLAEDLGPQEWICTVHDDCEFVEGPDGFVAAFDTLEGGRYMAVANPATVLALLDEIERLKGCDKAYAEVWEKARDLQSEMDEVVGRRDHLKAENETLRKDAARLTWLDESQEVDSVGPTLCCGKHRATLREAIDAAMAMEPPCTSTT